MNWRRRIGLMGLMVGTFVVLVVLGSKWREIAIEYYKYDLRRNPQLLCEWSVAPTSALRRQAIDRFIQTVEGSRYVVNAILCDTEPMKGVVPSLSRHGRKSYSLNLKHDVRSGGSGNRVFVLIPGRPALKNGTLYERLYEYIDVCDAKVAMCWGLLLPMAGKQVRIDGDPPWEVLIGKDGENTLTVYLHTEN